MKLFIFFLLAVSARGESGERVDADEVECEPSSSRPFHRFSQLIDFFVHCSFPFKNLHPDCVSAACPQLTTLCLYNSDGRVNPEALESLGPIITSCLHTQKTICEVNFGELLLVPHSFTTADLIDPALAHGSCVMNPRTGLAQYLNRTSFHFPREENAGSESKVTLRMNTPRFNYQGEYTCHFSVGEETRNEPLIAFPAMRGIANYSSNPTVTIDLATSAIEVEMEESQLSLATGNYVTRRGLWLPLRLVDEINARITDFFEKSPAETTVVRFLSTFAASALKATDQRC